METNEIIFVTVVSTLFLLIVVGFFVAFIFLYQKRQKQNELENVRLQENFNQELLNTQLELKEQVFKQISQEIHDNIGQSLTVAKMQLNYIKDPAHQAKADNAKELITRSLEDLRDLSKSLNGNFIMREGLDESVRREANYIDKSGEFVCSVIGHFPNEFLNENSEIILFRCIQECLSNAVKYSQGTDITIEISQMGDQCSIEIRDNGVGMPEDPVKNGGIGMDSLAKRVEVLNGELKIISTPGNGTRICIILNVNNQPLFAT